MHMKSSTDIIIMELYRIHPIIVELQLISGSTLEMII